MTRAIPVAILLLIAHSAIANEVMTFSCSEPKGPRVDVDPLTGSISTKEDRYAGVRPIYTIRKQNAQYFAVIWGNSELTGDSSPKTTEALIVERDENQIAGIEISGQVVYLHTLFPKTKIVLVSRQGLVTSGASKQPQPTASIFFLKCTVN